MIAKLTLLPLLAQYPGDSPDDFFARLIHLLAFVFTSGLSVAILAGEIYLIHLLFSLPMRRMERARLFLDLLDGALKRGQSVEEMILSLARSRDLTMGVRFHLLAAYIEDGLRLPAALEKVPAFLPPQICSILLAGEKLGDIKKILPACQEILRERPVAVRSALHYLILIALFFSPVFVGVIIMMMVFIVPKFKDVVAGMGIQLHPISIFVFANGNLLIACELMISLLMVILTLVYLGGPRLVRWFRISELPVVDWLAWQIPWKHKRLQRTFSAMLAVLLDNGVPEAEAIRLAGDCTANEICRRRAARVMAELEKGVKFQEALRAFDDSREFQWRLANAAQAHGGFLKALRGWHKTLDAKAFQQEEAAAHVLTTGVVILNGVFVALIAVAMFGILVGVVKGMAFSQ